MEVLKQDSEKLHETFAQLGFLMFFQKMDELKKLQTELLEREAKYLSEYKLGLTVEEAAGYVRKGKQQILEMVKAGVLEWRLCGEGDENLNGKKLICIDSLLRYKKQLWSKEFTGDGFFTNVQEIHRKAKVTEDEAIRMGIIKN